MSLRREYPILSLSVLFLYFVLIFICFGLDAFAQKDETEKNSDMDLNRSLLGNMINKPIQATPLDQPIDPASYQVGPGDELTIFIWGNIQAQYALTITPEGKLLVPTVGPLDLSGMTLAKAKQYVEEQLMERYRNVKVTTDLTNLRSFRVYVGGAVKIPGVYMANGATRVSEIISMAGGFAVEESKGTQWQHNENSEYKPLGIASHRNIILTHIGGKADTPECAILRGERSIHTSRLQTLTG